LRFTLALAVAAALGGGGCGRTSMFDGFGPVDGGPALDGPRPDGPRPDGPGPDGPCAASCGEVCAQLLGACHANYPGGAPACEYDCQRGSWPAPTMTCLWNAYCAPSVSCQDLTDCIQHPSLSCGEICAFAEQCGYMTVQQCLPICQGSTLTERVCASRAVTDQSCSDLARCYALPPSDCERICDYAIGSCGADVTRDECISFCGTQPAASIQCELAAIAANDCYKLSSCFQNPTDQPDLVVQDFYAFAQGTTVYYSATVCNLGGAAAGSFTVALYYNRSSSPTPGQPGNDSQSVASLAAGECTSLQLTRTGAQPGTYVSWLLADAHDQVVELDETNNVGGPFQVQVGGPGPCDQICQLAVFCQVLPDYGQCMQNCPLYPPDELACAAKAVQQADCDALRQCLTGPQVLPDLTVVSFTAQVSGSTVAYKATVCNQGNAASQGFYLDLYYDRPQRPAMWDFGDDYQPVAALPPLACQDVTFTRQGTPDGTYASWLQADADNYVAEANEDNNVAGPVTVTVAPAPRADLVISSFTAAVSGGTVDYKVTVCNQGQAAAASPFVDIYYDRNGAPAPYVYGDQSQKVAALAVGACAAVTITRTGTPTGTYRSWAQVDADNAVTEANEANNLAGPVQVTVQLPPLQQPDLVVQSFSATVAGQTVTGTVVVCNTGAVAAGAFDLAGYYNLNQAPAPGQAGDVALHIAGLAAGQCVTRSHARANTPAGTYKMWVYADVAGSVLESNEANNIAGPVSVTVTPIPPLPGTDLVVSSCTATVFQSTVDYEVVVCNTGDQAASHFTVGVYYNLATAPAPGQVGDLQKEVASLAAGACTTLPFARSGTPVGTYASWCQVDVKQQVAESNEANNVAGPVAVTVTQTPTGTPDLAIQSFISSVNGTTVTYTLNVCNVGDAAAGGFYVDLYYHRAAAPTAGIFGDQSQGVAGLAPQACKALTFTRVATPPGTYTSWVQADAQNAVAEANEANNVAGPAVVKIEPPLDCGQVCGWLISSCNLPSFLASVCQNLCGNLTPAQQTCVRAAMTAMDCQATWTCLQ
jgi:subtilase family serine protease